MSSTAAITVHAPLLERPEVRIQRAKERGHPGHVLFSVILQRPTDTLPCIATLLVGTACGSTLHVAHARAAGMQRGAMVRVEAEAFGISRTGKGKTRREALELLKVKAIDLTATRPAHYSDAAEARNDTAFTLAA